MMVVDIETSGDLFPERNRIWQIGAVDIDNPENFFFEECRIAEGDNVEEISLNVWKSFKRSKVVKIRNLICQSTMFDYGSLWAKNGIEFTMPKKTEEDWIKKGLPVIAEFCGIESRGLEIENGKVVKEGKSHNAPEDALETECFSRLVYGKNFIEEFGVLYALGEG